MGFFDFLKEGPDWERVMPRSPRPPTVGMDLPKGCYIPDWRQYKVEDAPKLLDVQKRLAARGLKSPWLRNDVWRFEKTHFGTKRWRVYFFLTRGLFRVGLPLFGLTLIYEIYIKKPDDHH